MAQSASLRDALLRPKVQGFFWLLEMFQAKKDLSVSHSRPANDPKSQLFMNLRLSQCQRLLLTSEILGDCCDAPMWFRLITVDQMHHSASGNAISYFSFYGAFQHQISQSVHSARRTISCLSRLFSDISIYAVYLQATYLTFRDNDNAISKVVSHSFPIRSTERAYSVSSVISRPTCPLLYPSMFRLLYHLGCLVMQN